MFCQVQGCAAQHNSGSNTDAEQDEYRLNCGKFPRTIDVSVSSETDAVGENAVSPVLRAASLNMDISQLMTDSGRVFVCRM